MKRPRVIGVVPIEFVSGEPVEREGTPTNRFCGQVVYFTNADVTVRLPSGAILVIDNYVGREEAFRADLRLDKRGDRSDKK